MKEKHHIPSKIIIDETLIKFLEEIYPDQCPAIDLSDREIWFRAGAVSVVRLLKHHHERQQQNILKGEII